MRQPTPAELAQFDQAWAGINERLDRLITGYREVRETSTRVRAVDLGSLDMWLRENVGREAMCELLTAAIARLA